MTKKIINKLYEFIARLVILLEEELDELNINRSKAATKVRKNITDNLGKLVQITIQLNKLKEAKDSTHDQGKINNEDQEIIERFIARYTK